QVLVRRIAAERVAPRAAAIDRDAAYPQDMFDLLRELGLFTLPSPPDYGGTGSLLSGFSNGTLRAGFSLTEPQSGSDVSGIRTRARRDGDGYRLTGNKIWCTNAAVSDFILVAARSGEEARGAINFFIVERDTEGFTIGRKEDKLGARGIPSSALFFDNAYVPAENMLGAEGQGFKSVMAALNASR